MLIKLIEKESYYLHFWHDYEFSAERYNWLEFTFIQCRIEFDRVSKNNEIHIALLGFHLFLNWT